MNEKKDKTRNPGKVKTVPGPRPAGLKGFLKSPGGKICMLLVLIALVWIIGKNSFSKSSLVRKGISFSKKGDYSQAQTCFQNAILKDNLNADNYYYLGMACLGNGDIDHALKQFQLALNLEPEHQGAYRGMGIGNLKKGNYEEAIKDFNLAIDYSGAWINEVDYDILWYRGEAETALGDYDAAAYTYGALLELEKDDPVTRYYRGNAYCMLDKKEEAMADFDAAIGKGQKSYELYWNIFDSMMRGGWDKEAYDYLALTMQPGYVDTGKSTSSLENEKYKGMIAYLSSDYQQAIATLSADAFSTDAQAQVYLALAYEQAGDYPKAEKLYREQKDNQTADSSAYNRFARFYIRRRQGDKAADVLTEGIQKFGEANSKTLFANLISAYETNGNYEEAQTTLKSYIKLFGESEKTKHEAAFLKERIRKKK